MPEKGDLQCQIEEHAHTEGCYDAETGELICQIEEHQHDDNCYAWEEVLTCPYAAESHQHSDECYTKEKGDLQCQIEEHTHAAECYNENNELICEKEEHTHNDECYAWNDVLTCNLEETPAGHTHTDACYEKKKVLTCGQLELHTHDESCQDENGALVCGLLELKEHTHQAECFETVELTDEEVAAKLEAERLEESFQEGTEAEPEENPEGEPASVSEDASVSGDESGSVSDGDASVSGDSASGNSVSEDSVSENDVHVHDESCYDAAGGLMCGYEDIKEPEITKTYKDDSYIVTAKYTKKADIPEKAELRAELITAESGGEHYAEREAEIRRALEDDSVSMNALFKIGFYVDEEEVEPKNDVIITVQFLDEKGMKDGSPIAIIHFAEGGSEVINGGKAKDKSTTFKTRSFSEFGIVEGYEVKEEGRREKKAEEKQYEDKTIEVSESCEYNNDMFQATFHIKGEVKLPADLVKMIEEGKTEKDKETPEVSENTKVVEKDMDTSDTGDEEKEESEEISSGTTDEEKENTEAGDEDTEEDSGENETTVSEEEGTDDEAAGSESEAEDNGTSADKESSVSEEKLEFRVEPIDESVEEYADDYSTVMAYMDEIGIKEDQLMHQVMVYTLTCNDVKLDLSGCKVSAEIKPTRSFKKTSQNTAAGTPDDGEEKSEVTLSVIQAVANPEKTGSADETTEDAPSADTSRKVGKVIAAAPVNELDEPMMCDLETETGTSGAVGLSGNSQANPKFTVEYYAYIDKLATESDSGVNPLPVIDTTGKNMPKNDGTAKADKKVYISEDGAVEMTNSLEKVYSSGDYEYVKAPGLSYFNKIAKNKNYKLINIQVKEKNATTWSDHSLENGKEWHFTNKQETANDHNDFILIRDGATVRLIYKVDEKEVNAPTNFYDYDISDGSIYTKQLSVVTRGEATTHDNGDMWYMYTNRQGINSNSPGQTFGFGNSESSVKTTMGEIEGNRANPKNSNAGSATFEMVTGLENGQIKFNDTVKAPNLFAGSATGKIDYSGNLIFSQKGDTYTLTGANVTEDTDDANIISSVGGLDKFRKQWNWNNTRYFAANSFYPLDTVKSAGTDGHDLMFGSTASTKVIKNFSDKGDMDNKKETQLSAPQSDDKKNHNHYFGMHYTVEFDLIEDYVGPLEYLFYGDDDMWVFLDTVGGEEGAESASHQYSGKLICDIGGVHSAIGEYVNLRDYLPVNEKAHGKYRLSFFYTERGASGSTCWMQFTLPSVSFATPKQETGELKIEKEVTGTVNANQEFGFTVKFQDKDGKDLRDNYSYAKYENGKKIADDVLIWDNAKFTLKANQYIVVSMLPHNSTYTITEVGPVIIKNPTREPGQDIEWEVSPENPYIPDITLGGGNAGANGVITGTITKQQEVQIAYNNIKSFELPETGGAGAGMYLMIGAFCIMTGAVLVYRRKIIAKRA